MAETKEVLAEGIMSLLRPIVGELDEQVRLTRQSQIALRTQMDSLAEELRSMADAEAQSLNLEPYAKELADARKRVAVVASILGNAQERLARLQMAAAKETQRRSAALEPPLPPPPATQS